MARATWSIAGPPLRRLAVTATEVPPSTTSNAIAYRLRGVASLLGLDGPEQLIRADLLLALRAVDLGPYASP